MPETTPQTSAQQQQISSMEIGRRELARRKLHKYVQYVDKRFIPTIKHVEYICKELDDVVRYVETGEGTPMLVITVPPRHLKTTIAADHLPGFFLGRNPSLKVIDVTYAASLAKSSSRRVRAMIGQSPAYDALFGSKATTMIDDEGRAIPEVKISKDNASVERWEIRNHGGTFQAVGVDGMVTGFGGNLIIVDDPHANRKEAESQTERNNAWTYIISTLWSRLEKNGAMVFIMQRWTEDDVIGRMQRITDPNSDEYIPGFPPVKYLNLPAIAEKDDPLGRQIGEALWPEFKDEKALDATRAVMGPYYFNSQYQQRATAPEGNLFKRQWFRVTPYMPFDYKIQYWDTAETEDGDYWAGITIGVNRFGLQLFDLYHKQMNPDDGLEAIVSTYNLHNHEEEPVEVVWVESKSSGKSVVSLINAGEYVIPIELDPVMDGDKEMRAGTIMTVCKNRRVSIVQHAPWMQKFLDEVCAFPKGKNDDIVDVLVGGVRKLIAGGFTRINAKRAERKRTPETGADYREQLFKHGGRKGGWRIGGGAMRHPPGVGSGNNTSYPKPLS